MLDTTPVSGHPDAMSRSTRQRRLTAHPVDVPLPLDLPGTLPPPAPRPRALPDLDPVQLLLDLAQEAQRLDARTRQAVGLARASGCTWQVIGDALGVARQSAHQRFGPAS
jgi:DNA-directed RNA polymerase specialized sigma24 family protein